jgi:hypothetical protein
MHAAKAVGVSFKVQQEIDSSYSMENVEEMGSGANAVEDNGSLQTRINNKACEE